MAMENGDVLPVAMLARYVPGWFASASFGLRHPTPDLIIRDRISGLCIGLEIKKLIQKQTGADSRGLTIDYNSCLPCGSTLIKIGNDTIVIPCYYLFALLNYESTHIVSLILLMEIFSIMTSIFTKRPNMLIILSTTMVPMEKVLYDIEKCIHTQTL